MKDIHSLINYLRNELAVEDVEQAAIILYLLQNGGRATKTDLIRTLTYYNNPIQMFYEGVLEHATALDIEQRDIFTYDPKTENYFLNVSLTDTYKKETAIKVAQGKINDWQDAQTEQENDMQPGKLVRDRIPEIIEAEGRIPVTETLDGTALQKALLAKLAEEHMELLGEMTLDEIADMMEVLIGIGASLGYDETVVIEHMHKKRVERGSFANGVFLKQVRNPTGAAE